MIHISCLCLDQYFALYIHWALIETYFFFRATLIKIHRIKINHIKYFNTNKLSSPHDAYLENQLVAFIKTWEICGKIRNGKFSKIIETVCWESPQKTGYSEQSIAIHHSISKTGGVCCAVQAMVRPSSVPGSKQFLRLFEQ